MPIQTDDSGLVAACLDDAVAPFAAELSTDIQQASSANWTRRTICFLPIGLLGIRGTGMQGVDEFSVLDHIPFDFHF